MIEKLNYRKSLAHLRKATENGQQDLLAFSLLSASMSWKLLSFVLIVILLLLFFLSPSITGNIARKQIPVENGSFHTLFCQTDDCAAAMLDTIGNATEVKCAFYDLDFELLKELLDEKDAEVMVFEDNYDGFGTEIPARHGGLMHDKFCVLDAGTARARVITGSTNPTMNGFTKNDNNLVIVEGEYLAQNYLDEWDELAGKKRERKVEYPLINHTDTLTNSSFLIENYFCPEDCDSEPSASLRGGDAPKRVIDILDGAKESIYFMTFSFTLDDIGDLLIEKHEDGLKVEGVFEKRQESQYSEYEKLKDAGMDVHLDGNSATMHHKVFIVDESTVLTGSWNPSKSGTTRNDENVLIIHNQGIAQAFSGEFSRVWAVAAPEP